jgi:hypothetical protein
MVPMLIIKLTLKIDILKMEQAFHMGYKEGDKVFLLISNKLERRLEEIVVLH